MKVAEGVQAPDVSHTACRSATWGHLSVNVSLTSAAPSNTGAALSVAAQGSPTAGSIATTSALPGSNLSSSQKDQNAGSTGGAESVKDVRIILREFHRRSVALLSDSHTIHLGKCSLPSRCELTIVGACLVGAFMILA